MSIFDKDRIGRSVCCEVAHADTGDKTIGYIAWVNAMVGGTAKRVSTASGHLAGPWTVVKVDVPMIVNIHKS